MINKLFALPFL